MKIEVRPDYQEQRRQAYPPVQEQLDALWKGGVDESAMRARILAIKVKHPKPGSGQAMNDKKAKP
jgi:hypothetical protein